MNVTPVGVADCKVTAARAGCLICYALGSCVAIIVHDPVAHVGGMLHLTLPDSVIHRRKTLANPYMFADTGIPELLRTAYAYGADRRRLRLYLAGGAQVVAAFTAYDIGNRNYQAARKVLVDAGLRIDAEDVGGMISRTVRLDLNTGEVWVRSAGIQNRLSGSSSGKRKKRI